MPHTSRSFRMRFFSVLQHERDTPRGDNKSAESVAEWLRLVDRSAQSHPTSDALRAVGHG